MAGKKRKLLKKSDLNGDKPTSALDAALKAPVGSGFFKPMTAYAGEKLFGKKKKKQKFENIDGMKIAVRKNKGGGLNAAIDRVKKEQGMKKGGAAFPDLTGDGKVTKKDILRGRGVKGFEEGGSTISDADLEKLRKNLPFVPGKSGISDADLKKLRKNLPIRGKSGKDISSADLEKLMKPTNYEEGGAVRGMGRAYMGSPKKFKIR